MRRLLEHHDTAARRHVAAHIRVEGLAGAQHELAQRACPRVAEARRQLGAMVGLADLRLKGEAVGSQRVVVMHCAADRLVGPAL